MKIAFNKIFILFFLIFLVRLILVFEPTINTMDLVRNLGFGKEFWQYGLTIYNYKAIDFYPAFWTQVWPNESYNYPAVALLFFALLAKIWPSIFFGKLILTLIEAVNTYLIFKITKSQILALLYFASPLSLWWISHEGQFEPLMIFFTLLALFYFKKNQILAYLFLGLSIQTKLVPILLLPYFVFKRFSPKGLLVFGVTFLPSLLFLLKSPYLLRLTQENFWNFPMIRYYINTGQFLFSDRQIVEYFINIIPNLYLVVQFLLNIIAIIFLIFLCYWMIKSKKYLEYFALIIFSLLIIFLPKFVPWYLLIIPIFALTVSNKNHRLIIFIFYLLLSIDALLKLFSGGVFGAAWEPLPFIKIFESL